MPIIERISNMRKGLRPPLVSTVAENGILRMEPDKFGMEIRRPTILGDRFRASLKSKAAGPNRDTAAKPIKNPRVAPHNPRLGLPVT